MSAEGHDGDLGGAAADVDDHGCLQFGDGQPGTDAGRHRLFDQVDAACAGTLAESSTARFSTAVMPEGTAMTTRGLTRRERPVAFRMK